MFAIEQLWLCLRVCLLLKLLRPMNQHENYYSSFLNPNRILKLNPKLDFRFLRDDAAKELKESKGSQSLVNQVF